MVQKDWMVFYAQWALTAASLATRLWQLDQPSAVVFDELYYVHFVLLYLNGTFHFDTNPPFGKLLVSLSAWMSGADASHEFTRIGDVYSASTNIWWLRFLPTVLGSLLVPVGFQILLTLGFSVWISSLAAILIILENALLTQSRFVLMEGPLIFCIAMATLSYIQFRRTRNIDSFDPVSLLWLGCFSIFISFAVCIKYIAIWTFLLFVVHSVFEFWNILPEKKLSDRAIVKHLFCRSLFFGVVPVSIYLLLFHLHFRLLVNAGPHDDTMTSTFQASLKGGLSSITRSQPQFVAYGSQITLRQTYGKPCWLHSHDRLYPIEYPDGRGSSHQQQVTCYSFKDVNNWWIVKHPDSQSLVVDNPPRIVRDGDVVQLIHGMTGRALNSHDVAAPISPQFAEVSCYIDYNVSSPAQLLWTVKIINAWERKEPWKIISSTVHLIHLDSSSALKISGRQLDDWGFFQWEVVTDRLHQQLSTAWNVEEHRYTSDEDDEEEEEEEGEEEEEEEGKMTESVHEGSLPNKEMGFFDKFWELQVKMIVSQLGASYEHRYSSDPIHWPLMQHNIVYWVNTKTNKQIHLLGNFAIWFPATGSVIVYGFLLGFYLLRRRRNCFDLSPEKWDQFVETGSFLFAGYFVHYLPYLLTDRTLFLYQYLPALFLKILLLAAVVDHIQMVLQSVSSALHRLFVVSTVIWLTIVVSTFTKYSALTYGLTPITPAAAEKLQLFETWDFIINRD